MIAAYDKAEAERLIAGLAFELERWPRGRVAAGPSGGTELVIERIDQDDHFIAKCSDEADAARLARIIASASALADQLEGAGQRIAEMQTANAKLAGAGAAALGAATDNLRDYVNTSRDAAAKGEALDAIRQALGASDTETTVQAAERVRRERMAATRDAWDVRGQLADEQDAHAADQRRIAELEGRLQERGQRVVALEFSEQQCNARIAELEAGYLARALRSLLADLGISPSGTGSEDIGLIVLHIEEMRRERDALQARVAEMESSLAAAGRMAGDADRRRVDLLAILRAIWPVHLAVSEWSRGNGSFEMLMDRIAATSAVARAALTPELLADARAAGLEVP